MYTLREFRKSSKKAFDDAKEGHEVVISRGSELYQLVALVDGPIGGSIMVSTPKGIEHKANLSAVGVKKMFSNQAEDMSNKRLLNGLCKVHDLPLDDRGRCLQKGCKYA